MPTAASNAQPERAESTGTAPASGSLPVAAYALGGVGVAALGVFTYFGLRARHDSDSLHDKCAPGCAHDDVTALKTKLVVADVALGVGVVSLAAATFFALRGSSRRTSGAWELRAAPVAGGARADVAVRF
jgi:hypothetical protein